MWDMFLTASLIAHAVLAPYTVGHILLHKEDPRGAFGWIAASILLPVGGPILYALFGINRIRCRAQRLQRRANARLSLEPPDLLQDRQLHGSVPDDLIRLAQVSSRMTGLPLLEGNAIELLHDGEEAYPAMLKAIDEAQHRVWMTTYIFRIDPMGRRFRDALTAAAGRGVEVRLLIDGVGCFWSWPWLWLPFKRGGVTTARFLPPHFVIPNAYVNLRNHRKVLLVDDDTGFTGGMNITSRHLARREREPRITDLHFRLSGPILGQIQASFAEDWRFTTGEQLQLTEKPAAIPDRDTICRLIVDGPGHPIDRISTVLFSGIAAARKKVVIMTPYFLPSREITAALRGAALRGIDVQIVIPEKLDQLGPQWARARVLETLLRSGVTCYVRPPPFAHTKLVLIDDEYALIGSANIDARSLRLNFEMMVEIYRSSAVVRLALHADEVVAECRTLQIEELENRALPIKLRDGLAWLGSPYM